MFISFRLKLTSLLVLLGHLELEGLVGVFPNDKSSLNVPHNPSESDMTPTSPPPIIPGPIAASHITGFSGFHLMLSSSVVAGLVSSQILSNSS